MDVRMPDGTVVKNVPEGTTKSELLRRYEASKAPPAPKPAGFTPLDLNAIFAKSRAGGYEPGFDPKVAAEVTADNAIDALPLIGGVAASFVPVPGSTALGTIGGSALAAGIGTGAGEVARQMVRNNRDPAKLAEVSGTSAVAAGATVGALKGLGALAKRVFSFRPDPQMQQAIGFAKDQNVPFPLSSAAPGTGAAATQNIADKFTLGAIRNTRDANRVAQFLNREVDGQASALAPNASPVDEASVKGQKFLREVFSPGETIYKQTFANFYEQAGGPQALVLTDRTQQAVKTAVDALEARGEVAGPMYRRLKAIADAKASALTAKQMNDLHGALLNTALKNKSAFGEGEAIRAAIIKDMDEVVGGFADEIGKADKVRAAYRSLRDIPGLEKLSKEIGSGRGEKGTQTWLSSLFANPDGRALAALRKMNPELYHELADSWLARHLNKFSRPTEGVIGRRLDGPQFRSWYEQNERAIKVIFGNEQAKALDNFSLYAKYMSSAASAADVGRKASPVDLIFRGAIVGGQATTPLLISTEPGAYLLAKGLADPNSTLFRLFTEGFKPSTREAMLAAGRAAAVSNAGD